MNNRRIQPASHLQPFVTSYIDFDMAEWPAGCSHRGLPDGTLALVITIGPPVTVRGPDRPDVRAAATVAGLRSAPVEILHDGTQRGIQLELTPRGARALLSTPAAALAEGVWPLDEVVGRPAQELGERLAGARDAAGRASVLDAVLTGWTRDVGYPTVVDAAWTILTESAGAVPVAEIAEELGVSRRHLGERVRAEVGLTPKTAARVLRFGHACRCLRSGRTASLAETAARCGYFDQAHLTNEWKQFAGCTPAQWRAAELPFLQDVDPRDRAG